MNRSLLVAAAVATALAAAPPAAQPPATEFEAATIKPLPNPDRGPLDAVERDFLKLRVTRNRPATARFRIPDVTLLALIQLAYNVKDSQLERGPRWVRNERYELDATLPGGVTTFDQIRPMLRSLLADRFKLALRREVRRRPVYELVPANAGIRITPMKEGDCVTLTPDRPMPPPSAIVFYCGGFNRVFASPPPDRIDRLVAGNATMQTLVDFISDDVERVVVDRTGFTARFNLLLTYAPLVDATSPRVESTGPTIFTALQDQLGLRLVPTEAPVDVLVIDRVERPTDN